MTDKTIYYRNWNNNICDNKKIFKFSKLFEKKLEYMDNIILKMNKMDDKEKDEIKKEFISECWAWSQKWAKEHNVVINVSLEVTNIRWKHEEEAEQAKTSDVEATLNSLQSKAETADTQSVANAKVILDLVERIQILEAKKEVGMVRD